METKNRLINDTDIECLDSLDEYSEAEILEALKYYYSKTERLEDEIQYEYENSLGWDI